MPHFYIINGDDLHGKQTEAGSSVFVGWLERGFYSYKLAPEKT